MTDRISGGREGGVSDHLANGRDNEDGERRLRGGCIGFIPKVGLWSVEIQVRADTHTRTYRETHIRRYVHTYSIYVHYTSTHTQIHTYVQYIHVHYIKRTRSPTLTHTHTHIGIWIRKENISYLSVVIVHNGIC